MDRFQKLIKLVYKYEGGYANHPSDPGGETYKGISRRAHGKSKVFEIIDHYKAIHKNINDLQKALDNDDELQKLVEQIYYSNYWLKVKGDDLPYPLGEYVCDFAINAGVSNAIMTLQRVLGVKTDGIIGPVTLGAAKQAEAKIIMMKYYIERVRYYTRICLANKRLVEFLLGWVRRTDEVYESLINA